VRTLNIGDEKRRLDADLELAGARRFRRSEIARRRSPSTSKLVEF